jgi:hypothetical protein
MIWSARQDGSDDVTGDGGQARVETEAARSVIGVLSRS